MAELPVPVPRLSVTERMAPADFEADAGRGTMHEADDAQARRGA